MYGQTYIPAKARRSLKKFFVITGSGVRGDSGGENRASSFAGKITRVFPTYPLLIGRLCFSLGINGSIVVIVS